MTGRFKLIIILFTLFQFLRVISLHAQWIENGVAICTAIGSQNDPQIISDGTGGAIITWHDWGRGDGYTDIYAQRVDASGVVQWTTDGVAICTATDYQFYPQITSDGTGGAIITWQDYRPFPRTDIYAQRVNASGMVQWTVNGVAICTATMDQGSPQITSDGVGGAIITWSDNRNGNVDVYTQRVDAFGVVQWTADGVAICTTTGHQSGPQITSDGVDGAIITWYDPRSGSYEDIYTQRVDASGMVQWTVDGVAICTAADDQRYPRITTDGAGGAIITWDDFRSGNNYDVYTQRVDVSGVVQWTTNGVAICTATGGQGSPRITSDGTGGAIITWYDGRSGNTDIYTQRVDTEGVVQWTADGVAICSAADDQRYPQITSDGAGGAIITWYDYRNGFYEDIYTQQVDASGVVQWTADGVAICTTAGRQYSPQITSDGAGGAIITWHDGRRGNMDIYANFIDRLGRVGFIAPEIFSVRDVPGDQGGKVYLSWYAAHQDVVMDDQMSYYSIWRAINPTQAVMALDRGTMLLEDLSHFTLSTEKPLVRMEQIGGLTYFWELVDTQDAYYMEAYGKAVSTLFDSTGVCTEYHYFQVIAHTMDPRVFWKSEPDSGYSVDNLTPYAPLGLTGEQSYIPEGLRIEWSPNEETDLDCYHVYRGTGPGFVPGPGNLIGSPCDTLLFDGDWRWGSSYCYKVAAVDKHGNMSEYALLCSEGITGEDIQETPHATFLAQNFPNPFNPMTRIRFGLRKAAYVRLRIYDASGRLVRALVDETRAASYYEEVWDGRDGAGRDVASGIYFFRLDAGNFMQTKKMVLLR